MDAKDTRGPGVRRVTGRLARITGTTLTAAALVLVPTTAWAGQSGASGSATATTAAASASGSVALQGKHVSVDVHGGPQRCGGGWDDPIADGRTNVL